MRCLVTGASGHLGAHLTRRLLSDGAEVSVLVRSESDLWRLSGVLEQVRVLRGDLTNLAPAAEAIHEAAPDLVFHLAWSGVTGAYRNDPAQITRNVSGSLALWEIAQAAGCRGWIGIGSQAEYGPSDGALHEDLPCRPITAYGVAKLCTGLLTQALCAMAPMRYLWVRLLAAYGPEDDPRHLLPSVITQLLEGKRPALTPGEQRWDYLYIDDAVEAISRLALTTDAQGVFNLGSGQAYAVSSLVEHVRNLIDPALPLGLGELPYRPDQIMHLQADIGRLQAATGWQPRVPIEEGLRRTVEWHRSRQSGRSE